VRQRREAAAEIFDDLGPAQPGPFGVLVEGVDIDEIEDERLDAVEGRSPK